MPHTTGPQAKVGFPSISSFNRLLGLEALKSPQIMQTLCLEACRSQSADKPLEHVEPSPALLPEIIRRTMRSYNYSTAFQLLNQGPPTRGSERLEYQLRSSGGADVYECLALALKSDPPFVSLTLDEIRQRVSVLLADEREPNVRSALQQYGTLFKEQSPPLDWDDEKRRLDVNDPHFYFYLRGVGRV